MTFDWQKIVESKRALRQRLTTAPIVEKMRMLDALHERAVAIRGARFRLATAVQEKPERYGDRKRITPLFSSTRPFCSQRQQGTARSGQELQRFHPGRRSTRTSVFR